MIKHSKLIAFAVAVITSIAMLSPAAADPKKSPPPKSPVDKGAIRVGVSQDKVLAACANTSSCGLAPQPNGNLNGCTNTVCFTCSDGFCLPDVAKRTRSP
jgi:hypothetical protein